MTAVNLCGCGCGNPAPIAKYNSEGYRPGEAKRYIHGHHLGSGSDNRFWKGGRQKHGGGYVVLMTGVNQRQLEHIVIAESALGKPMPAGARVHHVNGNRADNRNLNLVVCQDDAYHFLLHYRARAKAATGNANNKRCRYCNAWDALGAVSSYTNPKSHRVQWFHVPCERANQRERRIRRNAARVSA